MIACGCMFLLLFVLVVNVFVCCACVYGASALGVLFGLCVLCCVRGAVLFLVVSAVVACLSCSVFVRRCLFVCVLCCVCCVL